jgi:SAM-dependent methyltransferase
MIKLLPMRDVVTGFYSGVLEKLIGAGKISRDDKVLVVCGGPLDRSVVAAAGFRDFVITGLEGEGEQQDAERLTYADGSFDVVIAHAGLHHCHSPHRALLEMYRVARKAAIAFESRDSLLIRTAVRLGLTMDYETDSVTADGKGGVAESGIPNFVYRWTERDVLKTIASYDPSHVPQVDFFYDLRIPILRLTRSGQWAARALGMIVEPFSRAFAAMFPRQCNEFGFAIIKGGKLQTWIKA